MEQNLDCTNIGTWVHDLDNQVFRYTIYKKVYTPYEQQKCFSDESEFENGGYYNYAYITNVIEIPNDLLLELEELEQIIDDNKFEPLGIKTYVKLSEIRLYKYDCDNE